MYKQGTVTTGLKKKFLKNPQKTMIFISTFFCQVLKICLKNFGLQIIEELFSYRISSCILLI